jgi:hypothetical protein
MGIIMLVLILCVCIPTRCPGDTIYERSTMSHSRLRAVAEPEIGKIARASLEIQVLSKVSYRRCKPKTN